MPPSRPRISTCCRNCGTTTRSTGTAGTAARSRRRRCSRARIPAARSRSTLRRPPRKKTPARPAGHAGPMLMLMTVARRFSADFVRQFRAAQVARYRPITAWAEDKRAHLKRKNDGKVERAFVVHRTRCDVRWIDAQFDRNDPAGVVRLLRFPVGEHERVGPSLSTHCQPGPVIPAAGTLRSRPRDHYRCRCRRAAKPQAQPVPAQIRMGLPRPKSG